MGNSIRCWNRKNFRPNFKLSTDLDTADEFVIFAVSTTELNVKVSVIGNDVLLLVRIIDEVLLVVNVMVWDGWFKKVIEPILFTALLKLTTILL